MAFHLNGYSNFHDDNQDWIVSKIKSIEDTEAHTEELAEAAQASADASQASAEAAQLSAEASQASAEAAQLSAEAAQLSAENSENSATDAANTVANTVSQINVLQSRVDNIIPDGTQTEGNTELLDIRVGYDGEQYTSAGNAVRDQVSDLHTELENTNDVLGYITNWEGLNASVTTNKSDVHIEKLNNSNWYGFGAKHKSAKFKLKPSDEYVIIAYGTSTGTVNYVFYLAVVTGQTNFGKGYVFIKNVNTNAVATDHLVSDVQLLNPSCVRNPVADVSYAFNGANIEITYDGLTQVTDITQIDVSTSPTMPGTFDTPMIGLICNVSTHGSTYDFKYYTIFDSINTLFRWVNKKWCSFGDSLTGFNYYQPLVKNELQLALYNNMGVGGSTIAEKYSGQTAAFCNRYDTIPAGYDVITIQGGTNDFGQNIPLGTKGNNDKTTFYGGLEALLNGIKTKFPTTPILFISPLQRDYFGTAEEISGMTNNIGVTLKQYNDIIIECCSDAGIPCIDMYSNSGLYPENVHDWTIDGLHPNQTYWNTHYQLISDFINKYKPTV